MANALDMRDIARSALCPAGQHQDFRKKLDEYGFVVLQPGGADDRSLDDIMSELGEPVEYGFGPKLDLQPKEGSDNLQFTTRAMPLHTDGNFNAGPAVRYIGMHCVTAPEVGGETLIASNAAFFAQAPADLLDAMQGITIEYRNRISGYYRDRAEGDHPTVAPIQDDPVTGRKRLVIGLTDPDDPMRTHDATIVGHSAEESAELLERIKAVLHQPSVLYAHKWQVGEVIVQDNLQVVHGRAAFPDQPRKLVRLSVA
ncbi:MULTISPECIES: TauD/TfdA dioxygenase family protein [Streptomyces]|uniref:TauD/TfdA dioxygenase family protein n=1 Tax=Streptomyces TaxID=1883 RepID=UPI0004AB3A0D|nr:MULTISPECIES: TauD/TfdA family dioxygenase [Streptomyces]